LLSPWLVHIAMFNYRPALAGISFCSARAASGHAAALPSPAMNSRRRILHLPKSRFIDSLSKLALLTRCRQSPRKQNATRRERSDSHNSL
jgi:hypothetical protein